MDFNRLLTEKILQFLLTEATIKDIYTKYYSDIPEGYFQKIISSDPTYNPQKPDKMGKYGKWLLSIYKKGDLKLEDLYKATEYLTLFNKYYNKIEQKDINSYKTLPELFAIVKPFKDAMDNGEEMATSKSDEVRKFKKDVKKLYEDSNWLILIPLTKEAAIYYGKNTEWCTAATKFHNMFDYYNSRGPIYINIDKRNNRKYQFQFETSQFMDENDHQLKSPIADTIGMDVNIIKQAYPNGILTLTETTDYCALGNRMYAMDKDIIQVDDNGEYKTLYKGTVTRDADSFIKLGNNVLFSKEYSSDGLLINVAKGIVSNIKDLLENIRNYRQKNGRIIFYGHYKGGLIVGAVGDNDKLTMLHNFHTTAWPRVLDPDDDEDTLADGLRRYITVSTGYGDAYDGRQTAFDVYDLETLSMVLESVVYDNTKDYVRGRDRGDDGEYRYYTKLRKTISDRDVEDKFYEMLENGEFDEDMTFDYTVYNEIAYDEATYYLDKWIVYDDTGEIVHIDNN